MLEHHRDYAERARNFHSKEKRLLSLRRTAELRNPDEYYFGMHSARTDRGVHVVSQASAGIEPDVLRVLKAQDQTNLELQRTAGRRALERMRAERAAATGPRGRREEFSDDDAAAPPAAGRKRARETEDADGGGGARGGGAGGAEDARERAVDAGTIRGPAWAEGAPGDEAEVEEEERRERETAERLAKRRKKKQQAISLAPHGLAHLAPEDVQALVDPSTKARVARESARRAEELKDAELRLRQLDSLAARVQQQRHLMAPGRRKKVGTRKDPVSGRKVAKFVWKKERKR